MKKILLIDGNSIIFRAYYGQAYQGYSLTTSNGVPTSAVLTFINMVTNILRERQYYDVKVAFDKGKKTFRHEKLENYKAGRNATPPELIEQFPIAREFLDSANIDWFELENFEADDLIGTIVKKAEECDEEFEIEIFSSDKDMFQLISPKTKIVTSEKGNITFFGEQELMEKYSVAPKQVPDLKGLMGDSSDNLKGVEGVGQKTAAKLLIEYNDLNNIYQNIEKIKGALKDKLIKDQESAFLCKEIATIFCDIQLDNLKFKKLNINLESLMQFLQKYEMKSLVDKLTKLANIINQEYRNETIDKNIEKNNNSIRYEKLEKLELKHLSQENYIYVESFESNYHKGQILALIIVNEKGNFIINNWLSDENFKSFLKSNKFLKITFDIKKVWTLFKNCDLEFDKSSFIFDHMVAMYIIDSNLSSKIQNINLILNNNELIISDDDVYGKGVKKTFDIDEKIKNSFSISKALCLKNSHKPMIEILKNNNQFDLYQNIEFPLIHVIYNIEQQGILIDKKELANQTLANLKKIDKLEELMHFTLKDKVDSNFNFSSPKQIKELLFDTLDIEWNKKQSTDKEVLEKLVGKHPVVELLLEHRKISKLYSTYLRGFEKFIFSDNKVHTILNQTLTNTGRLSSSDPNIQNISIKDDIQKEVRKIFICDSDKVFLSFDYSQIELRVLAQLGDEENLLNIFKSKRDVHDEAARLIFNLNNDELVTSDQRRTAKIFNFGIIYGLSGYGLSNDLNISILQANLYIQNYYKAFPKFEKYKQSLINFAKKEGYSKTITNRTRKIEELFSPMHQIREFGKRIAVNMPIQGTAADILKVAMIKIHEEICTNQLSIKMVAQIHDEIIFEIPKLDNHNLIKIIETKMQEAFKDLLILTNQNYEIKVDLDVNWSVGSNWFELK